LIVAASLCRGVREKHGDAAPWLYTSHFRPVGLRGAG